MYQIMTIGGVPPQLINHGLFGVDITSTLLIPLLARDITHLVGRMSSQLVIGVMSFHL